MAKRNAAEALLSDLGYATTPSKSPQIVEKEEQSPVQTDKNRKVTFVEEKHENQQTQNVGGSGGRQLVPGVLLVTEPNVSFAKPKPEPVEAPKQVQPAPLKNPPPGVRSKDQLMYLAQLMNIQVISEQQSVKGLWVVLFRFRYISLIFQKLITRCT